MRGEFLGNRQPTPHLAIRCAIMYMCRMYILSTATAQGLWHHTYRENEYTLDVACPASRDMFYGVTAIDRFGNESGVAEINHPVFKAKLSEPGMKVRGGKLRLDSVDACFLDDS